MLSTTLSLLSVLPLALAAPTCQVRPSSAPAPQPSQPSVSNPPSGNPSSGNPSSGNTTTGAGTSGKIAMGWYPDWHPNYKVGDISWTGYTHMAYFTAQPSSSGTVELLDGDGMVDQFTTTAKAHGVKPILTVGGWDGSIHWSSSVATDQSRSTFANSLAQFANAHGFVGLDFDWEYPGKQGIGCNVISPQDSANFLSFVQEMRKVGPNLTLSAAAGVLPWVGADGNPMSDLSEFAKVLDWTEVMNYDVYGTFSSVTGPNSPLNDTCSSHPQGSAVSAVAAWTKAGFPAEKIVLGVASYGHSFTVPQSTAVSGNNLNFYTSFDKTNIPMGDSWGPAITSPDICGNPPVGNGNTGVFNFWGMFENGFLAQDGSVASGMVGMFDECSQTPFVYDPSKSVLVSYDDTRSFAAKGAYIKNANLRGFAMYSSGGDYKNMLVGAITKAMA